jgi:hypothetical protein
MKSNIAILFVAALVACVSPTAAQDVTFFFSAGDFSGEPDRFGNTHLVGPADAIESIPFGDDHWLENFFDLDDKWLVYEVGGNKLLVSHAPARFENSPELSMNITMALGGKFEVILNFLDSNDFPGDGPLKAAIGDAELIEYTELNSIRATGGVAPGYPGFGNTTAGTMWWQSVSIGEVEVDSGDVITVRVDDAETEFADIWVTSSFQGVTLRVLELGGAISEIQVSPGAIDWVTDISGNQFKTGPDDENLTQDQWLTIGANSSSDNLWNIREGLGSYGPIIESFPLSGEDAPPLQTSVIFAQGGDYDVFFSLGDIGPVDPEENLQAQTPVNFAIGEAELTRWFANDGEFKGSPGYNDYEMFVGKISVADGEQVNFRIDDVQDDTAVRSVYLGMRLVLNPKVTIQEFQVSPGVFDPTVDLFGNTFSTGPADAGSFPNREDWLTVNANSASDGLWNIREGLGSYGPILESFPNGGDDAPSLQTSVTFAVAGTYNVYFSLGDTGAVDAEENLHTQTPLNFAFEGNDFTRWHANDGTFNGSPGYNDYEMSVGQITVAKDETKNFLIDDVQDDTATRSVYLGMRFEFVESSGGGGASDPVELSVTLGAAANDPNQNEITLSWASTAGSSYTVEASNNLSDWSPVGGSISATGESTTFTELLDAQASTRFYRLRQ